jgi:FAD-dependent urate hydroxylase
VRVTTPTGRRITTVDLTTITARLGAPVRMVPRRLLLERLLEGFPAERIRFNRCATGFASTCNGVRVEFDDGSSAEGDLLIGADGLHSSVRDYVGGPSARPTGWCSWQGLVTLSGNVDRNVALMIIGEHGSIGLWPAGGSDLQWWFDLPWSSEFIRPPGPIEMLRSHFAEWSDLVDRVLATLNDEDLAPSPFPHFRHPIPRAGRGAVTLLGDAAHTMPPTLAQGTNQALLDTMVLCKALSNFDRTILPGGGRHLANALRWYEKTRRRQVKAVSWVTTQQVSRSESMLKPAAMISDRFMTWALAAFLHKVSHSRMSAEISRELAGAAPARVRSEVR